MRSHDVTSFATAHPVHRMSLGTQTACATFELARMILLEATLSFLGLGVQPPTATWGAMINDGKQYIYLSWAVSLMPGLAIVLIILAFNMLGDELRDALDPQLSETR